MATDTPDSVVCACVQISSGPDRARNIAAVREGLDAAAARGAQIVALPEAVDLLDPDVERMRSLALRVDQHPAVRAFSEDARRLALWISVGSVTARNAHDEVVNRSVLLDPSGAIACEYDKIHLFDASIAGPESQGESAIYTRGHEGRLGATPWGLLGLTICYDLRFPHLFRALAQAGATLFMVPSGFLRVTGEAHWHVLLRARA
ncbi:MAG: nitrilase-related carbon-nitrogen hydrolase, partial [Steroidobacteraceae bacterium]